MYNMLAFLRDTFLFVTLSRKHDRRKKKLGINRLCDDGLEATRSCSAAASFSTSPHNFGPAGQSNVEGNEQLLQSNLHHNDYSLRSFIDRSGLQVGF